MYIHVHVWCNNVSVRAAHKLLVIIKDKSPRSRIIRYTIITTILIIETSEIRTPLRGLVVSLFRRFHCS